jgi:hypothetical protein
MSVGVGWFVCNVFAAFIVASVSLRDPPSSIVQAVKLKVITKIKITAKIFFIKIILSLNYSPKIHLKTLVLLGITNYST